MIILVSYIYFSVSAGPRYMKDKKPYELRNVLIVYNFIQVMLSMYLLYEGLMSGWLYDYNYFCQPVDYSDSPQAMRVFFSLQFLQQDYDSLTLSLRSASPRNEQSLWHSRSIFIGKIEREKETNNRDTACDSLRRELKQNDGTCFDFWRHLNFRSERVK